MEAALDWLLTQQNADGSYSGATPETSLAYTAEVVTTLLELESELGSEFLPAAFWLSTQVPRDVDDAARRLDALGGTPFLGPGEIDALNAMATTEPPLMAVYYPWVSNHIFFEHFGPHFGWNLAQGAWQGSSLDTALAARALRWGDPFETVEVLGVLCFLQDWHYSVGGSVWNGSGGWGPIGDEPDVRTTARAMLAIQNFAYATTLDTRVALPERLFAGSEFLLAHQNPDGGFGDNGVSSVYETALSILALEGPGGPGVAAIIAAFDWLAAQQLPDGSFVGDVRDTAIAARALDRDQPDIYLRDSALSSLRPRQGEILTAEFTVGNGGYRDAGSFVVQFYHLLDGETPVLLGEHTVPALAAGADTTLSWDFDTAGLLGGQKLYILLDTDDDIPFELDESNNAGGFFIHVDPPLEPDLTVSSNDIAFDPYTPESGEPVSVTITVRNVGLADATATELQLYDGDPLDAGAPLGAPLPVPDLAVDGSAAVVWSGAFDEGSHPIFAVVDEAGLIAEADEGNNLGYRTLHVYDAVDLALTEGTLAFAPEGPVRDGTLVTITATVVNRGNHDATGALLGFYHGDPVAGGQLIGSLQVLPDIAPGSSAQVSVSFDTHGLGGFQDIVAIADPDNAIWETDEFNNVIHTSYAVELLDVYLPPNAFQEEHFQGELISHNFRARSVSYTRPEGAVARLYLDDGATSKLLREWPIDELTVDRQLVMETEIPTDDLAPGLYTLRMVLDEDNVLQENDRSNNEHTQPIEIFARTDFEVLSGDIQFDPDPVEQGDRVEVTALVGGTIEQWTQRETQVLVELFVGDPEAGGLLIGRNFFSSVYQTDLPLSSSGSWESTGAPGSHEVFARVSQLAGANETNFSNNTAQRTLVVGPQTQPDLMADPAQVSIAPDPPAAGDLVTITALVQNTRAVDAGACVVRFFEGDPLFGGVQIGADVVTDPIGPSGTATAEVSWDTAGRSGVFEIHIVVDPDNLLSERNEVNNASMRAIEVRLPPEAAPTDLAASVDYSDVDLSWTDGGYAGIVGFHPLRDGTALGPEVVAGTSGPSGWWCNHILEEPCVAEVDLGGYVYASRVNLNWVETAGALAYEIQIHRPEGWVTVASGTDANGYWPQHVLTGDTYADRLRIVVTEGLTASTSIGAGYSVRVREPITDPTYLDQIVPAGAHDYQVVAVAADGQRSTPAGPAGATVQFPQTPASLSASVLDDDVSLAWAANPEPEVSGYLVIRDGEYLNGLTNIAHLGRVADSMVPYEYAFERGANDGDTGTSARFWVREDGPSSYWWELTLDRPRPALEIAVEWDSPDTMPSSFQLEARVAGTWQTLADLAGEHRVRSEIALAGLTLIEAVRVQVPTLTVGQQLRLAEVEILAPDPVTDTSFVDTSVPGGLHEYSVAAIDSLGQISTLAATTSASVAEVGPPTGLIASVSGNDVTLTWTAPAGVLPLGYQVYRDGGLVNDGTGTENLALGRSVTASSYHEDSGAYPEDAADGSLSSVWCPFTTPSGTARGSAWLAIDLGNPQSVSSVHLEWTPYAYRGHRIEVDQGGVWVTVADEPDPQTGAQDHVFAPVTTSRVRLFVPRAEGSSLCVRELEVYGAGFVGATTYVDADVPTGDHQYTVSALDPSGSEGQESDPAFATIGTLGPPENLAASVDEREVSLNWDPPSAGGAVGYTVYRSGLTVLGERNVAIGGTATASATQSGYHPANAIDGKPTTWKSGITDLPITYEVALVQSEVIEAIELQWAFNYGVDYAVEADCGAGWEELVAVTGGDGGTDSFDLEEIKACSTVRLTISDSSPPTSEQVELVELRLLNRGLVTTTSLIDVVDDLRRHRYTVTAVDLWGFESLPSNAVEVDCSDDTPPAPPANLLASLDAYLNVDLTWDPGNEDDLLGYNVYVDGKAVPEPKCPLVYTHFDHARVWAAGHHEYAVTAEDLAGNESEPALVSVTLPAPLAPTGLSASVAEREVTLTWVPGDFQWQRNLVFRDGALLLPTLRAPFGWTTTGATPAYQASSEDERVGVGWRAAADDAAPWIRFFSASLYYFPADPVYTRFELTWADASSMAVDFDVQLWIDGQWQTVAEVRGNASPRTVVDLGAAGQAIPGGATMRFANMVRSDPATPVGLVDIDAQVIDWGKTLTYSSLGSFVDENALLGEHDYTVCQIDVAGQVSPCATLPASVSDVDLVLTDASVFSTTDKFEIGREIEIYADVQNTGILEASAAVVRFFDGDPGAGGTLIGESTLDVPAGGTARAQIYWTVSHETNIFATADPDDLFVEPNESNNTGRMPISLPLPYRSTVYRPGGASDLVLFGYHDSTYLSVRDSDGFLVWTGTVDRGQRAVLQPGPGGLYRVAGDRPFSVMNKSGEDRAWGAYLMGPDNRRAGTELYGVVPSKWQVDAVFTVVSYTDDNEVVVANSDNGEILFTDTMSRGQVEEIDVTALDDEWPPQFTDTFVSVFADEPVSALVAYDSGFTVPATTGLDAGTEFIVPMRNAIPTFNYIVLISAVQDNTAVRVEDINTGELLWQGVADRGPYVRLNQASSWQFQGRNLDVTADKDISVMYLPDDPDPSVVACFQNVAPTTSGSGIGTDMWVSIQYYCGAGDFTLVSAYQDGTTVTVTDPGADKRFDQPDWSNSWLLAAGQTAAVHQKHDGCRAAGPLHISANRPVTTVFGACSSSGSTFMPVYFADAVRPDLVVQAEEIEVIEESPHVGDVVHLRAWVRNLGLHEAEDVPVKVYAGNAEGELKLMVADSMRRLLTGDRRAVQVEYQVVAGQNKVLVQVDPENAISETDETNNEAFIIIPTLPDLEVRPGELVLDPAAPIAGQQVTVTATVRNVGGTPAGQASVRFYDGAPEAGGEPLGPGEWLPLLGSGASVEASVAWDTADAAGEHLIYVVVDQDGEVEEEDETNNQTLTQVTVSEPTDPDLTVSDPVLDPASPYQDEPATLGFTVTNQGTLSPGALVQIYDGDPLAGGVPLTDPTRVHDTDPGQEVAEPGLDYAGGLPAVPSPVVPPLQPFDSIVLSVPWEPGRTPGAHELWVVVDPDDDVTETDETNNAASLAADVQAAQIDLTAALDGTAYEVDDPALGSITATNLGGAERTVALAVVLEDEFGNEKLRLIDGDPLVLPAGVPVSLDIPFDVPAEPDGDYRLAAVLLDAGSVLTGAGADFAILPDLAVGANLYVDHEFYDAGDDVTLSLRLEGTSLNHTYPALDLVLRVRDPGATELWTTTETIYSFKPGDHNHLLAAWSTEDSPAGTYTAEAEVLDGGVVRATSVAVFDIRGSATTGAGVGADITASPEAVDKGDPVTLSFSLTNEGNEDVLGVNAVVRVRHAVTGDVTVVHSETVDLLQGATHSSAAVLDSNTVPGGWYAGMIAAELGGNVLAAASDGFLIRLDAPVIHLSGVSDGQCGSEPVTPEFFFEDDDLAASGAELNGEDFTSGTTIEADGDYTLYLWAEDTGGTLIDETVNFAIDATDPQIAVSGVADGVLYDTPVTPVVDITEAHLTSQTILLDGAPFVSGTEVSAEGSHTLAASAEDCAGNTASASLGFTIDLTPPAITIAGVSPGVHYNVDVTPTFSATDAHLDAVNATLDGAPFTSGTLISDEGTYELIVTATDLAGNEASETVGFVIDKTPPVVSIAGVSEGAFNNASVTPTFSATDDHLDTVEGELDGAPFVTGTVVDAEGPHTVIVTATDLAGNEASESVSFTLDLTLPAIAIAGVSDGETYNTDVTPTFSAADTNLDAVSATLNGAPFTSGSVVGDDGEYELIVEATDLAGNLSSQTVNFTMDQTPPEGRFLFVADGASYGATVAPLFVVFDEAYNLIVTLDGVPVAEPENPVEVSDPGVHALVGSAEDAAGNLLEVSVSFEIDPQPGCFQQIGLDAPVAVAVGFDSTPYVAGGHPTAGATFGSIMALKPFEGTVTSQLMVGNVDWGNEFRPGPTAINALGQILVSDRDADAYAGIWRVVAGQGGRLTSDSVPEFPDGDPSGTYRMAGNPPATGITSVRGLHADLLGAHIEAVRQSGTDVHRMLTDAQGLVSDYGPDNQTGYMTPVNGLDPADTLVGLTTLLGDAHYLMRNDALYRLTEDTGGGSMTAARITADDALGNVTDLGMDVEGNLLLLASQGTAGIWPYGLGDTPDPLASGMIYRISADDLVTVDSNPGTPDEIPSGDARITLLIGDPALPPPDDQFSQPVTLNQPQGFGLAPLGAPAYVADTGNNRLVLLFEDEFGALQAITADLAPSPDPVPFILADGAPLAEGSFLDHEPVLTFGAADDRATSVSGTLDGAPVTSGSVVSGDGAHAVHVLAEDSCGYSVEAQVGFTIDTTPPLVQITGVSDGASYANPVTITYTAYDANLATLFAWLDGAPFASGSTVSAEGPHTLVVTATDLAGNETTETVDFSIDTEAPVVTITGVSEGAYYNHDVYPEFTATDSDLDQVWAELNGAPFNSGDPVSAEAYYELIVTATDLVGHVTIESVRFTIDKTDPSLGISGVADGECYASDVAPTYTIAEPNLNYGGANLDGAPFVSGSVISSEGQHVLSVYAFDLAGHESNLTHVFFIDKTLPELWLSGVAEGAFYNHSVTPEFGYTDTNPESIEAWLNGVPFTSGTVVSAEGEYDLTITATDCAGNENTWTVHFTIDLTPPAIVYSGAEDGGCYGTDLVLSWSLIDDNPGGSDGYLSGVPFTSGSTASNEWTQDLFVTSWDLAGNTTDANLNFTIDKTDPEVLIWSVEEGQYYSYGVSPGFWSPDPNLVSIEGTLNGAPFETDTLVDADGEYDLVVTALDCADNEGTDSVHFTVDQTLPLITITGASDGTWYDTDVTPVITIDEVNLDSSEILLNGAPFSSGTTLTEEGEYWLEVSAVDLAGNGDYVMISFGIDRTTPECSFMFVTDNGSYNGPIAPLLLIEDEGELADVQVLLDGNPADVGEDGVIEVEDPGSHALFCQVTDGAGHTSDPVTLNFEIGSFAGCFGQVGLDEPRDIAVGFDQTMYVTGGHPTLGPDVGSVLSLHPNTGRVQSQIFLADTDPEVTGPNEEFLPGPPALGALGQLYVPDRGTGYDGGLWKVFPDAGNRLTSASVPDGRNGAAPGTVRLAGCEDCIGLQGVTGLHADYFGEWLVAVVRPETATVHGFLTDESGDIVDYGPDGQSGYVSEITNFAPGDDVLGAATIFGDPVYLVRNDALYRISLDELGQPIEAARVTADSALGHITDLKMDIDGDLLLLAERGEAGVWPYAAGDTPDPDASGMIYFIEAASLDTVDDDPLTADEIPAGDPRIEVAAGGPAGDPILDQFGEPVALHRPQGLDVHHGGVGYVADTGADRVIVLAEEEGPGGEEQLVAYSVPLDAEPDPEAAVLADGVAVEHDSVLGHLPTITIEYSDDRVDSFAAEMNGEPFTSGTALIEEGSFTFEIVAQDTCGYSAETRVDFSIDLTPPVVEILGVSDGAYYNTDVAPSYSVTDDNLASVTALINGEPLYPGNVISDEGTYTIEVTAVDVAGHTATESVTFTIDKTAPVIGITGVADGEHSNDSVFPEIAIIDDNLDTSEILLDGAPFVSGTEVIDEGTYLLEVSAVDLAGNEAELGLTFVIDRTPPVVTIAGVEDGAYYTADVAPTFTATDENLDFVQGRLDGAPFESGTPVAAEGAHQLVVTAVDQAGNAVTESVSFVIDKTAPAVSIAGVSDGAFYDAPVTPTYSATDTYLYSTKALLNGTDFVSGTAVSTDGAYTLTVEAWDRAGNSVQEQVSFTVDQTAPAVSIAGVAEGECYDAPVTPTFSVADANPDSLIATLNGAPFTSGTAVSADGEYTLIVTAVDLAGNSVQEQVSFIVDQTAPAISLSGVADGECYGSDVTPLFSIVEDHIETQSATLNGAHFTSGTTISAEGSYDLAIAATDCAGNSTTESAHFVIDKTDPAISLTGVADGEYYNADVTPVFSISDDNLISQSALLDGAPFTSGTTISVEGAYDLVLTAEDCAGNSTITSAHFTIDTTAPAITIAGVADGAYYNTDVAPTFTVTDANPDTVDATLNGAPFTPGSMVTAEDGYDLVVTAVDLAGNETTRTVSFTINKTAPAITLTGIADGECYGADVTPVFSITDDHLDTSSAMLDGAPFTSGTVISSEGAHVLALSGTDLAGNSASTTASFIIDKTDPAISVAGVSDGAYYNVDVTPTFTITDDNLTSQSATLNGASFTSGTTITAEGSYDLVLTAEDCAGNSTITSAHFTIDKTAPAITVGGVTDGTYYDAEVIPTFSATDDHLDTMSATLNGAPFTSGTPVSADGAYDLVVTAVDLAGNSSVETVHFVVDTLAPVVTVTGVSHGAYYDADVVPEYTVTDDNLDQVAALLDGAPFVSGTPVTAEGPHTLTVTATDLAGNTTVESVSFTIDKTDPVVSITGVTEGAYYDHDVAPEFSATDDNLGSVTATVNGVPFISGSPITADGTYELIVTAVDLAGNTTIETVTFTVDQAAPLIVITGVADGDCTADDVVPVVSITDANLDTQSITLDGAPYISGTPITAEGEYELIASATDLAGNSASQTVSFTIDRTNPVASVIGVTDGAYYNADVTPEFGAMDDHLTSIEATLNGADFVSGTLVSAEDDYVLIVTATDCATNSDVETVAFAIDKTAPLITIEGVSEGGTYSPGVEADITVTDDHLDAVSILLDGAAYVSGTPIEDEGEPTLEVTASDLAGNESSESVSFTIEAGTTPEFPGFGVCVLGDAWLENNFKIRGYDPVTGSKVDSGRLAAHGDVTMKNNAKVYGDVVSGGDVSLKNNSRIKGDLYLAGSLSTKNSAEVEGEVIPVSPPPQPCECGYDLDGSLAFRAVNNDNDALLADPEIAPYIQDGSLVVEHNDRVVLPGGVYYFASVLLRNNATLSFEPEAEVELYVERDFEVLNNAELDNHLPHAARVLVVAGADTDAGDDLRLRNNVDLVLSLFAPRADLALENNADVYGSLVARSFVGENNGELLGDIESVGGDTPLTCGE